jgi:hypothetical protein
LFDEALANVKAGKSGLAQSKALARFEREADPKRMAEVHVSVQGLGQLLATELALPARLFRDPAQLSSLALSVERDRLNWGAWVPIPELRVLANRAE